MKKSAITLLVKNVKIKKRRKHLLITNKKDKVVHSRCRIFSLRHGFIFIIVVIVAWVVFCSSLEIFNNIFGSNPVAGYYVSSLYLQAVFLVSKLYSQSMYIFIPQI